MRWILLVVALLMVTVSAQARPKHDGQSRVDHVLPLDTTTPAQSQAKAAEKAEDLPTPELGETIVLGDKPVDGPGYSWRPAEAVHTEPVSFNRGDCANNGQCSVSRSRASATASVGRPPRRGMFGRRR